ncbi:MAG: phosphoglycerate kinase [bacterium]
MKIKSIKSVKNLSGKTILLRVDLNVPMEKSSVKSDYKIAAVLPTIRYLLRHNAKIIIITHIGKHGTAKPVSKRLSELLGEKILFISQCVGDKVENAAKKMKPKDIIFLENLRSDPGEEKNSRKFAKLLAKPADIYVNDAFAASHRDHASVSAVKKYLPSYSGLLLEKEILNLNKISNPNRPLVSIIGGNKIKTKIAFIKRLAEKSERILIGGALANNFIAAHGFEIGKSAADQDSIKIAGKLAQKYKNIILPVDVIAAEKTDSENCEVKPVNQVSKTDIILDIGPRTIKLFASFIKKANTIIWNGPLGHFENEHCKHGTMAIARFIAARSTGHAFGVAGGGETVEALKMTKMENDIDYISTGGGAMMAYIGGEKMPGLKGIIK